MNKASTIEYALENLTSMMEEGRWERALFLIDKALENAVDDAVFRANRCICSYHLGQGKEVLSEIDYLLGDWPRGLSGRSLLVLGLLCGHEAKEQELCDRIVLGLAQQVVAGGLTAWDMPTVPIVINENSVVDTRLVYALPGIIAEVRERQALGGGELCSLDWLLATYREREELGHQGELEGDTDGHQVDMVDPIGAGRLLQVLGAFIEEHADPASPAAHLIEEPSRFAYGLVQDLGYKMIYVGEGADETILIHVWNYDIPLPQEAGALQNHRIAMEAWCRRALAIRSSASEMEGSLPLPIFMVDLDNFGGIVARL